MQFQIEEKFVVVTGASGEIIQRLFNSAMKLLCTILAHTTLDVTELVSEVVAQLNAHVDGHRALNG